MSVCPVYMTRLDVGSLGCPLLPCALLDCVLHDLLVSGDTPLASDLPSGSEFLPRASMLQRHHLAPFPFASVSDSSLMKTFTTPSPTSSLPSSNPGLTATAKYFPSPEKPTALTLLAYR